MTGNLYAGFVLVREITIVAVVILLMKKRGNDGMEVLNYIAQRKEEILGMLRIDRKIGADPYDNVARLKELKKVEKIIQKLKTGETNVEQAHRETIK